MSRVEQICAELNNYKKEAWQYFERERDIDRLIEIYKQIARIHKDRNIELPEIKELSPNYEKGLPALMAEEVSLNSYLIKVFMAEILSTIKICLEEYLEEDEKCRELYNELENMEKLVSSEQFDPASFISSILKKDREELAKKCQHAGIKMKILSFVVINAVKPIVETIASKKVGKIEQEKWLRNYCPVCGSLPAMAKLRKEDGQRYLWCPLCESQWYYKRIACPYCQTEVQKDLKYFTVEDDELFQVKESGYPAFRCYSS